RRPGPEGGSRPAVPPARRVRLPIGGAAVGVRDRRRAGVRARDAPALRECSPAASGPCLSECSMPASQASGRLQVLTWHVHGNYLYYLSRAAHDFHLVTLPGHPPGHAGRVGSLPWGANVHEVAAEEVAQRRFDCVLYQSRRHWDDDRFRCLSDAQRALPAVYLEHDPPQQHPTATRHPAADSGARIVHVTSFNALMWDNG